MKLSFALAVLLAALMVDKAASQSFPPTSNMFVDRGDLFFKRRRGGGDDEEECVGICLNEASIECNSDECVTPSCEDHFPESTSVFDVAKPNSNCTAGVQGEFSFETVDYLLFNFVDGNCSQLDDAGAGGLISVIDITQNVSGVLETYHLVDFFGGDGNGTLVCTFEVNGELCNSCDRLGESGMSTIDCMNIDGVDSIHNVTSEAYGLDFDPPINISSPLFGFSSTVLGECGDGGGDVPRFP